MKPKHIAQIFLLSAAWGISFLMIRIAATVFPPVWVGMLRSGSGAVLLLVLLAIRGNRLPPRKMLPWLLAVALFNNAIPFSFFAWGEQTVPSNTAAVLNATVPIWTMLLGMAVHRTRMGIATVLGVLIGFAGVSLVVYSRASDPAQNQGSLVLGIVVILLATLGYAIATTIAKAKLQGLDPVGLASSQLALAACMLVPVAALTRHPSHFALQPLLAILVLGFIGSGLAFYLYFNLLAHIPATHVVAVTYLLPVWGIFWGLVAHEQIAPMAYAGVLVVIAGLVLMNTSLRKPSPKQEPSPAVCKVVEP
ncbi:DMT family transporter [Terriglobus tenax]|uniref:DMT family transporter n=1 Tax=Terriglobus tenax TaxID=1111115 RepID=UPI0021E0D224|nr:DMT family transporter [Terriglobus tenax]